jgi:hypothetical protein
MISHPFFPSLIYTLYSDVTYLIVFHYILTCIVEVDSHLTLL